MVKKLLFFLSLSSIGFMSPAQPVLKNPGIPAKESFEINELVDPSIGRANSKIDVSLTEQNGGKVYKVHANEGGFFANDIILKYNDLTTISEKRTDLRTGKVIQSYEKNGNTVHFYNAEKNTDKTVTTDETNIYSPLAYYFSFRGFPFDQPDKKLSFKTYMYAYGDVLTMNLAEVKRETVTVKAGTYECYVLALSVGGWQSWFAPDIYYLYFTVAPPHIFVQYKEKVDNSWSIDELLSYSN